MKRLTKHLIVISFDGLSTLDLDYISKLPNFKAYFEGASGCKRVYSVYPSLTYPAHTSIITGKYPKNHGIVNNTKFQPKRKSPDWFWQRKYIKADTVYDKAIDKGMKVAALLWPVTGRSRIQFNFPEIFANRKWKNQIIVSLMNGSPLYQLDLARKFGKELKGIKQPYLDNFVHKSLLHTLETKRPDLTLVHYVDLDSTRHYHGFDSKEAKEALNRHDLRLGQIINKLKELGMYEESTIIVLGDHSSLDEDKIIKPNVLLKEKGYIKLDSNGKLKSFKAILKNCDGSAYIYLRRKNKKLKESVHKILEDFNKQHSCIEKIYTSEEAAELGADKKCAFMLEANLGYYFSDASSGEAVAAVNPEDIGKVKHMTEATHGYSPYKKNYTTVFMAKGRGIKPNVEVETMSLVDEGPTMAQLLGIELSNTDGRIVKELISQN
jgi:predicted AlkP superfamily pyrophosphatase or phosphodiesterase